MTNPSPGTPGRSGNRGVTNGQGTGSRRLTTETKAAYLTTEFWLYVAAVIGVFITSQVIGTSDGHNDYFRADRAWLYVVLLTIAYLLSRGLAKSGSREPYQDR